MILLRMEECVGDGRASLGLGVGRGFLVVYAFRIVDDTSLAVFEKFS